MQNISIKDLFEDVRPLKIAYRFRDITDDMLLRMLEEILMTPENAILSYRYSGVNYTYGKDLAYEIYRLANQRKPYYENLDNMIALHKYYLRCLHGEETEDEGERNHQSD